MKNPALLFWRLGLDGHFKWVPDARYLRTCFRIKMGYSLDLESPRTFNEKLQWLKLYDRRPEYVGLVDKLGAREYVEARVGASHLIPLLGVWDGADAIDFSALPARFVLKCTHDSGSAVICRDRATFHEKRARAWLARRLRRNYFWAGREWPYLNIRPRIIAEAYMTDESETELKDYKFFCFHGEPKVIQVDFDRFTAHKRNLYDPEWNRMPLAIEYPDDPERNITRPHNLDQVLSFVEAIAPSAPFVRVDLYLVRDRIYFGEFTFYHGEGLEHFRPAHFDAMFGSWIRLPSTVGKPSLPA